MKNDFNKKIVSVFNSYFPQAKELAHYLMDILDLSRESVYRRLRSEVPFSFEEICIVAQDLDLSIDKLIGLKNTDTAHFDLKMHQWVKPEDVFLEILQDNIEIMWKLQKVDTFRMYFVLNRLPFCFTLTQKILSKFYYYKWCVNVLKGDVDCNFSNFTVPDIVYEKHQQYIMNDNLLTGEMIMILDENIFLYMIKEIDYFRRRGLLNNNDLMDLQQGLSQVVDRMELMVRTGTGSSGAKIRIYLSAIDIEPSYLYAEYGDKVSVSFWSPQAELATTHNPVFCAQKKEWIESLTRYTTLISQCNEMEQTSFFSTQRSLINAMGAGIPTIKQEVLYR
ncbi:helix-turn-helix domain-containing protein [uncultured Dysgonomonas sp.]|uniref:Transcription regulator BetR N-terminal domain-containing protein n=1 Tax=uncultured Dysgonomonas sp. TaxID=206096 RepID=A0A212IY41_9BACT|nr:helix-turn-helix domain-containing protein [uncultured Dysgonomonas sp.]SBV92139.1 conserved hypothetical protein [uncultured Dysgonomonas sp.]